ncbi:MAG: efflux RND transporter periplasmic adaptor subunit [Aquificaceae bacterium]|nr:efflux RND transporter periplasmic adaptor subunit [Aquificaceae bacterium]
MKKLGAGLIVFLLILFGFLSYRWIKHRIEYAITDAVFIRSDRMVNLSFEVSGRVVEVYKDMGDKVEKGEVLARIEPEDYRLNLEAQKSRLESLIAQRDALKVQVERLEKQLSLRVGMSEDTLREISAREEALTKQVKELELQIEQTKRDRDRLENLLKEGLIPRQRFEQVDTHYQTLLLRKRALEDGLKEVRSNYSKAQKELRSSEVERLSLRELREKLRSVEEEIKVVEAQLKKTELDLKRTELLSPVRGVVAKRLVSAGDTVRAGQPVFSLIEEGSFYAEALLEETKLRGVKVGSNAYLTLDAYPDKVFEGEVEEISPASAGTFALVPRDVSAGEFTKVVQRIPVKIRLKKGEMGLLRVGMGGRVEIKRE